MLEVMKYSDLAVTMKVFVIWSGRLIEALKGLDVYVLCINSVRVFRSTVSLSEMINSREYHEVGQTLHYHL